MAILRAIPGCNGTFGKTSFNGTKRCLWSEVIDGLPRIFCGVWLLFAKNEGSMIYQLIRARFELYAQLLLREASGKSFVCPSGVEAKCQVVVPLRSIVV